MRLTVVGTGYVGLPTAISFAEHGHNVTCIDLDQDKVDKLRDGVPTIHEAGLEEALGERLEAGNLRFTTDYEEGVLGASAVFCAVGTPEKLDGSTDMSFVHSVARSVGSVIADYTVIVNKSTVPVGTAREVADIVRGVTDVDFDVVSNPEFMAEGTALLDVRKPERVVIGSDSDRAIAVMREIYEAYVRGGNPIRIMSPESAELTKYAANACLALRTTLFNEIASLAAIMGADVEDVRRAMGDDRRIGKINSYVGPGWGGSCFPKDVASLIRQAETFGYDFLTIKAADRANDLKMQEAPQRIEEYFGGDLAGRKIALWGLAFKKGTDDMRVSPATQMLDDLVRRGATVVAYDPAAVENARQAYKGNDAVDFRHSMYDVLDGADALLIATDWEQFTNPDIEELKRRMNSPVVFDWRNLIDPEIMRRYNVYYEANGRPVVKPSV